MNILEFLKMNMEKTGVALVEAIGVHIKNITTEQIEHILELCWSSNKICVLVGMLLMLDVYSYEDVEDALLYGAPILDVDVSLVDLYILETWTEKLLDHMDNIPDNMVDRSFIYLFGFNLVQLMYMHYDASYISNLHLSEKEEREVEVYLASVKAK